LKVSEEKFIRLKGVLNMTKTLLCLVGLLLVPSFAYSASPSASLSINVVPANTAGNGCELQNHGPIRGRPKVVNGTLVADDGCLLRTASGVNTPSGAQNEGCGPSSFNLSDWQAAVSTGHYNTDREGSYINGYDGDPTSCPRTLDEQLSWLSTFQSFAAQTGMYLMITGWTTLDGSCSADWTTEEQTFWPAVAQQFGGYTNVIFELQNEPDACGDSYSDIVTQETRLYQIIRQYAPNTPIVFYSLANIAGPDESGYGLVNMVQQTVSGIGATPIVGWHAYWNSILSLQGYVNEVISAGYPLYMTEYGTCTSPAGGGYSEVDFRQLLDWLDPAVAALDGATAINSTGQTWTCGDGYPDGNANFIGYIWPQD
jgi:Cellulase (glycosyl hydrolase family 5)